MPDLFRAQLNLFLVAIVTVTAAIELLARPLPKSGDLALETARLPI